MALVAMITAAMACLLLASEDQRQVLAPAVSAAVIAISVWVTLWRRDGVFPLFDAGSVCMAATLLYTLIPLCGYLAAGLRFTALSDNRMMAYDPTPAEVGGFAWRYVLYLACLGVTYAVARGRPVCALSRVRTVDARMGWIFLALFLVFRGYFVVLQGLTGVDYYYAYKNLQTTVELHSQLPLFVQQVSHNLKGMCVIFKLALLVIVLQRYDQKAWRIVFYAWLAIELIVAVVSLGARMETVVLLIAAGLLAHRLVRPLPVSAIALGALALLVGFFLYGFSRDIDRSIAPEASLVSVSNEFQCLFGTAYDLQRRVEAGAVEVPWQVYVADLTRLVPQQVLPFEKIEPAEWYLELIGKRGTGLGLMFGVIAEGVIAGGWIGLALRGALLGLILAWVHRWYTRNSQGFFATLIYAWLCTEVYYTFRASTFYPLVFVEYTLIPALLLVRFVHSVGGPTFDQAARTSGERGC